MLRRSVGRSPSGRSVPPMEPWKRASPAKTSGAARARLVDDGGVGDDEGDVSGRVAGCVADLDAQAPEIERLAVDERGAEERERGGGRGAEEARLIGHGARERCVGRVQAPRRRVVSEGGGEGGTAVDVVEVRVREEQVPHRQAVRQDILDHLGVLVRPVRRRIDDHRLAAAREDVGVGGERVEREGAEGHRRGKSGIACWTPVPRWRCHDGFGR